MSAAAGLRLLAALACLAAASGCASDPTRGYSFSSTYDAGVRTVGVPMFDNTTFVTGIEAELTDAVVKEIQARTPWRVVAPGAADTQLAATITAVELGALSRTQGPGFVQEQSIAVACDFSWRDNRSGETLVERRGFRATQTFVPARGERGEPGERLEIGRRAAIAELARAIVTELRSGW